MWILFINLQIILSLKRKLNEKGKCIKKLLYLMGNIYRMKIHKINLNTALFPNFIKEGDIFQEISLSLRMLILEIANYARFL